MLHIQQERTDVSFIYSSSEGNAISDKTISRIKFLFIQSRNKYLVVDGKHFAYHFWHGTFFKICFQAQGHCNMLLLKCH